MTPARALTVAGSDPSGGAGIQQDLKTFHVHGVWGMSAITALTIQNSLGVQGWHAVPPEVVAAQIAAVAGDLGVDAAKTGMLASAAVVEAAARALADAGAARLVVDPVMVATSGDALIAEDAVAAMRAVLLPLAALVTPNGPEAARLTGLPVRTRAEQVEAARAILAMGARAALVTGGHLDGERAVDVLVDQDGARELDGPRIDTPHTHGTGCMLSAAIAANLARGLALEDAVRRAKKFVTGALRGAVVLGKGIGSVNPGWERL